MTDNTPIEQHEEQNAAEITLLSNPNPQLSTTINSISTCPLIQFRNGFFQGNLNEFDQRQGKGVYYWNSGEVYYGDWNLDRMEGEGILYFALGGYVYGTFLDDKVHGHAILCFSNGDYIAGFWERGVLSGKAVQYSKQPDDWYLYEYKEGTPEAVLSRGRGTPPIRKIFEGIKRSNCGIDNFSMLETFYLKKLVDRELSLFGDENAAHQTDDNNNGQKNVDFLPIDPQGWYHGNIKNKEPHGLGIVCYSEDKSDRGLFKDGVLNGPGRSFYETGDVYDGFYKDGKFHGVGIYFKSQTEQYLYGMYENNECTQALTLGNGYPHELIKTTKTDFKLEGTDFIDKETDCEVLVLIEQSRAQSMAEGFERKEDKTLAEEVVDRIPQQQQELRKSKKSFEDAKEEEAEGEHGFVQEEGDEEEDDDEIINNQNVVEELPSHVENIQEKPSSYKSLSQKEIEAQIEEEMRSYKSHQSHQSQKSQKSHHSSVKNVFNSGVHQKSFASNEEKVESKQYDSLEKEVVTSQKEEPIYIQGGSQNAVNSKNLSSSGTHKSQRVGSLHKSIHSEKNPRMYASGSSLGQDVPNEVQHKIVTSGEIIGSQEKVGSLRNSKTQIEKDDILEKIAHQIENINTKNSGVIEKVPADGEEVFYTMERARQITFSNTNYRPTQNQNEYTSGGDRSPDWGIRRTEVTSDQFRPEIHVEHHHRSDNKLNKKTHDNINNEVDKIMNEIFKSPNSSNHESFAQLTPPLRGSYDMNGSFGVPVKKGSMGSYSGSGGLGSFRNNEDRAQNLTISTSKNDLDGLVDIKVKTPVREQIEHSPHPTYGNQNMYYEINHDNAEENLRRGSKGESGRMVTETWSVNTLTTKFEPSLMRTPELRGHHGGSDRDNASEILDGMSNNTYNHGRNGLGESNPKVSIDDEICKVMMLKLELLLKEQSKTNDAIEEIKKVLNTKLELLLLRQDNNINNSGYKGINEKIDALTANPKDFDSNKAFLKRMQESITEYSKSSSLSLGTTNYKLDTLLTKFDVTNLSGIAPTTTTPIKTYTPSDYILPRPEIYIQGSNNNAAEFTSAEFKKMIDVTGTLYGSPEKKYTAAETSPDLISAQIFKSQYDHSYAEAGSASTWAQPNSALPTYLNQSSPTKYEDMHKSSPYLEPAKYTATDYESPSSFKPTETYTHTHNYDISSTIKPYTATYTKDYDVSSSIKPYTATYTNDYDIGTYKPYTATYTSDYDVSSSYKAPATTYTADYDFKPQATATTSIYHHHLSAHDPEKIEKTPHFIEDLSNYTSVVSESTPVKEINAITPKARTFYDKNEPTFNQQFNSRISTKSNNKSRHSAYNTQSKPQPLETEDSGKVYRSPIPSNKSSAVVADHNVTATPDRLNKSEFYNSRISQVSSHSKNQAQQVPQRTTPTSVNASPELKKSQIHNEPQPRDSVSGSKGLFKWNFGFCGQNTMIDEPEAHMGENQNTGPVTHKKDAVNITPKSNQAPMRKLDNITEQQSHTSESKHPSNRDYIRIDNQKHGHHQSMALPKTEGFHHGMTRSAHKPSIAERNSQDMQDHMFNDLGVSPVRFRREPLNGMGKSSIHEGRMGSVRWRLELEHVDDESERHNSRRSVVEGQEEWTHPYIQEMTHEQKIKENHKRSSRPLSMSGNPTQQPQVYYDQEGNQIYKLSDKAKQNFIVDQRMDTLLKTSEVAARKGTHEYLEKVLSKALSDTKPPKKHSHNFSVSSSGNHDREDFGSLKRSGLESYTRTYNH